MLLMAISLSHLCKVLQEIQAPHKKVDQAWIEFVKHQILSLQKSLLWKTRLIKIN